MSEILGTFEYSKFKSIKGNREISTSHINHLQALISRENLLEHFPIIVNQRMEVVDGQHRLEVAKKYKKEIFYQVVPDADIDTVINLNTSSSKWQQIDFLRSWANRGNEQYEEVAEFMELNSMPLGCSIRLLGWNKVGVSGAGNFRQGKFHVNTKNKANQVVEILKLLRATNSSLVLYSHKFLQSLMLIVDNPIYDKKQMVEKIKLVQPKIYGVDNVLDYTRQMEDVFNYNMKKPIRFA